MPLETTKATSFEQQPFPHARRVYYLVYPLHRRFRRLASLTPAPRTTASRGPSSCSNTRLTLLWRTPGLLRTDRAHGCGLRHPPPPQPRALRAEQARARARAEPRQPPASSSPALRHPTRLCAASCAPAPVGIVCGALSRRRPAVAASRSRATHLPCEVGSCERRTAMASQPRVCAAAVQLLCVSLVLSAPVPSSRVTCHGLPYRDAGGRTPPTPPCGAVAAPCRQRPPIPRIRRRACHSAALGRWNGSNPAGDGMASPPQWSRPARPQPPRASSSTAAESQLTVRHTPTARRSHWPRDGGRC